MSNLVSGNQGALSPLSLVRLLRWLAIEWDGQWRKAAPVVNENVYATDHNSTRFVTGAETNILLAQARMQMTNLTR